MLVTNIRKDGVPIGSLPDGEMFFHHDKCYAPEPDWGTMLYAIEVTREGGHTLFANMYEAWETLADDLKARIEGRKVLHIYKYLPTERVDLGEGMDRHDHCWQPAVVRHPRSGRRALYVNELMTALVEGYAEEESRKLLDAVIDHVKAVGVIYEHVWKPGDLVMWDNWCTMHARTDFPRDQDPPSPQIHDPRSDAQFLKMEAEFPLLREGAACLSRGLNLDRTRGERLRIRKRRSPRRAAGVRRNSHIRVAASCVGPG